MDRFLEKSEPETRAYRLSLSIFDESGEKKAIREDRAPSSIPIPESAQGMAFDADGNLWISCSSKFGALHRLNPQTGAEAAAFDMPIGIEDLAFDETGKLWAVSEAGSRIHSKWAQVFPLIFQVDPSLLR